MVFQVSEISDKELKFGLWFSTNKQLLIKVGYIAMIVINILLFTYIFWGVFQTVDFLFVKFDKMSNQMLQNKPNFTLYSSQFVPLSIIDTYVLGSKTQGTYDFLAKVKNTNTEWSVTSVKYRFNTGFGYSQEYENFILPNDEKYLMVLGYESESNINKVELEILDLKYQRINDFENIKQENLNFTIAEKKFIPATETDISNKTKVSQIKFNISNESYKDFWEIGLQVILNRGNRIVGATYVRLSDFLSNSSKNVSINWFENSGSVSDFEVLPEINILDASIFKNAKSSSGELK